MFHIIKLTEVEIDTDDETTNEVKKNTAVYGIFLLFVIDTFFPFLFLHMIVSLSI